ncbi:hypothetical protein [Streptomyces sp. NPDC046988]|uniref:hypothetical protein n=1 Tax=Streptomyces sp. NPDC046988 TaxID=3154922 RepID=UPI0033C55911
MVVGGAFDLEGKAVGLSGGRLLRPGHLGTPKRPSTVLTHFLVAGPWPLALRRLVVGHTAN